MSSGVAGALLRVARLIGVPVLAALLSLTLSVSNVLPAALVEAVYARRIFPVISRIAGVIADAVPFSWLDPLLAAIPVFIGYVLWRRKWRLLVNTMAAAYLVFFFGWGLNYHRTRIETKLEMESRSVSAADVDALTDTAVHEINRLWKGAHADPLARDTAAIADRASNAVRRFLSPVDGTDWSSAKRVKRVALLGPWFRWSGIAGMFNPFGHEPIVVGDLTEAELPFSVAHELAHVRGYPDEGDANFIAFAATVTSKDPLLQYSGWLNLWMYLPRSKPLDPGPQEDIGGIMARLLGDQIPAVSRAQSAVHNTFLKANGVREGIRSYNRLVAAAAAAQKKDIIPRAELLKP